MKTYNTQSVLKFKWKRREMKEKIPLKVYKKMQHLTRLNNT